jgi:CheY-like chemotaxis protein
MRILIVEDDENKRGQLAKLLKSVFPAGVFDEARSYRSGLTRILQVQHDLILLDMSMPTFDKTPMESGGRFRPFAGREIMAQMKRLDVHTPVIVVTQFEAFGEGSAKISFDELEKQLRKDFKTEFAGMVYYNPAKAEWPLKLAALVQARSAE